MVGPCVLYTNRRGLAQGCAIRSINPIATSVDSQTTVLESEYANPSSIVCNVGKDYVYHDARYVKMCVFDKAQVRKNCSLGVEFCQN
jgi:hypothetical protein